jgi:hypothetical protein
MASMASVPPLLGEEAFSYYQTFSKNICDFLNAHGTEVSLPKLQGIRCWFVILSDGAHLHVYAETISDQSATCDQCRIIGKRATSFRQPFDWLLPILGDHFLIILNLFNAGWGTHPVSSVRYHFIIPAEVSI